MVASAEITGTAWVDFWDMQIHAVDGLCARSYNAQTRIEETPQHRAAATIEGLTDGFLAEEDHLWQRTRRLDNSSGMR